MGWRSWTRREALLGLCASSVGLALPAAARAARGASPPRARLEPVRELLSGAEVVDPYRWMEDPADRDWEPFLRGQAAQARSVLDAIPGRAALHRRLSRLSGELDLVRRARFSGGRLFYERRPPGEEQFRLYVRNGLQRAERLLVDPAALRPDDRQLALDWWVPSHGGEYLAFGLSADGSEDSVVLVVEVDTGRLLPDHLDRAQLASLSWLPDGTGFFLNRLAEGAPRGSPRRYLESACWLHRLGADPARDLRVLSRGQFPEVPVEPGALPAVTVDPTSQLLVARLRGGLRGEGPLYTARLDEVLEGKLAWRRLCGAEDEVVGFASLKDALWLLTTRGAPNGKVLRLSSATPTLAGAEAAVPEGPAVIERMVAARDGLYLQERDGGVGSLRHLDPDGPPLRRVPLPFEGTIEDLAATPFQTGVWLTGTGWLLPRTTYRHDPLADATVDAGLASPPELDLGRFEVRHLEVAAGDGARLPLALLAPRGLARNGRAPALVEAQGATAPAFEPHRLAFLEKGGALALAPVRGGGPGRRMDAARGWRDLVDCCQALVKQGIARPERLVLLGSGAGAIAVGLALAERPELFAAVVSRVGLANPLRAGQKAAGPLWAAELGVAADAEGSRALLALDAYQAVRDGVAYPAVLLTAAAHDAWVAPWQAAKLAARLQRASTSGRPVLLRVAFDAGHGAGARRAQLDEEWADVYAFALWRASQPASPRRP